MLQLGGTEADARTAATCHTVADPLGPATGWTEFIRNDANRYDSETEGTAAYGGNLGGTNARNVAIELGPTPASTPTLVVKGTLTGTINLNKGSAYVASGGTVNYNGGPGAGPLPSTSIDFDAAFTELESISTEWAGASTTGTVTAPVDPVNGYLTLEGANADLNVFNLTQADLPGGNGGVRIKTPVGSMTIINVTGSATINLPANPQKIELWTDGSWQQASGSASSDAVVRGIVWNFPTATAVNIRNGGPFAGTVLAPKAHVSVSNDTAHTVGQMIAKSFASNRETHLPFFLDEACVPGNPPPAGEPNVTITKTASVSSPHGGDSVTYTLLVENIGSVAATGVVATDVLPAGVTFDSAAPGCSFGSGTVACAVGTLAAGGSKTYWIKVIANPIAGAGAVSHPQANHWLTPYKKEQQVDLEPGDYKTVTLSCEPGDILADGHFRIDHVDQDTGTIADDVEVYSSRSTATGTWTGIIRNFADGRAQAKAFIVCLPEETEAADRQTGYNDSHKHPLSVDPAPVVQAAAYGAGTHSATLTCPTGTMPIAPGFDAATGGVVLTGSEYATSSPRDWRFTIDVDAPTTVTFSVRCLRLTVGPVYGHTHELRFTHLVQTVTVSGHTAKEGDEFKVICPDDAKGIVATWDLPPGVQHFGNDPRLKERAFRLYNDTGVAKQATIDLLCLRDRTSTEQMGTSDPVVVTNTATVTADADSNPHNNSSSVQITVQPGSSTTGLGGSGRLASGAFTMKVASSMPGTGKLTVKAGRVLLARGTVGLKPGRAVTANLKLTWAGKRQLAKLEKVTVRVDPTRGKATTRTVKVVR